MSSSSSKSESEEEQIPDRIEVPTLQSQVCAQVPGKVNLMVLFLAF